MDTLPRCFAITLVAALAACQSPSHATPADGEALQGMQGRAPLPPEGGDFGQVTQAATWSPQDGLTSLLLRAQSENPRVRHAFHSWKAAIERVDQVTALPDPWVSLQGYVQSIETRSGPIDGRIGFDQRFPWPGKLDAEGEVAAANAETARWRVEELRLEVRRDFLKSWVELAYLQEAQTITAAQVVLLEHVEEVSLRLYEASKATQAEVLRAQVERLQMQERGATLAQKAASRVPRLEALLGAPSAEDALWAGVPIPEVPALANSSELKQRFATDAPALQRLDHAMRTAENRRKVAEFEDRPDLSLGADWTWIGQGSAIGPQVGEDAFSVRFGFELPLQASRVAAARREAMVRQKVVGLDREATVWELQSRLDIALSDLTDAERRLVLYRDQLLLKGEQAYEVTLSSYQSGQADFQDMLEAAQVVLDFRLSALRAKADAALAYADLTGLMPVEALRNAKER